MRRRRLPHKTVKWPINRDRNLRRALHWTVKLLRGNRIPFVVVGGFAARLYGVDRKLADIDVVVPSDAFPRVAELAGRTYFGPRRYVDHNWNLDLLAVYRFGFEIDFTSNRRIMIFDRTRDRWTRLIVRFSDVSEKKACGLSLPVMSKKDLICYKSKLRRRVDIMDVEQLKAKNKGPV